MLLIIVLASIAITLGLLLGIGIYWSQSDAKKTAKRILQIGRIENPKECDRILKTLSHTTDDLEAADLWKKLNDLKEAQAIR